MSNVRVGTLTFWDRDTYRNEVEISGVKYEDCAVIGAMEALTYREGDQVLVVEWQMPLSEGLEPYVIIGRLMLPDDGIKDRARL